MQLSAVFLCTIAILLSCGVALARFTPKSSEKVRAIDTCYLMTCYNYNQTCVGQQSFCTGNSSCTYDMSQGVDVCRPDPILATLGAACKFNSDCYSGRCVNSRCNQGYYPGTPCSSDDECLMSDTLGNPVTTCLNKKCSGFSNGIKCSKSHQCDPPLTCGPDGICMQPRDLGAGCDEDSDCREPNTCENNVCTAPLAEGAHCDYTNDLCGGNTICTPMTQDGSMYQCIQAYSQSAGDWCTSSVHCGEKLSCPDSIGISACAELPVKSSFKKCDYLLGNNSGCGLYETCSCNYKTGPSDQGYCVIKDYEFYGNKVGSKKTYADYWACREKCDRSDYPCFYTKCKHQICAYQDLAVSADITKSNIAKIYPSCAVDYVYEQASNTYSINGYFTCDGAFLQYSLVMVVIFVIAQIAL